MKFVCWSSHYRTLRQYLFVDVVLRDVTYHYRFCGNIPNDVPKWLISLKDAFINNDFNPIMKEYAPHFKLEFHKAENITYCP